MQIASGTKTKKSFEESRSTVAGCVVSKEVCKSNEYSRVADYKMVNSFVIRCNIVLIKPCYDSEALR
jgi:hypothetical protein